MKSLTAVIQKMETDDVPSIAEMCAALDIDHRELSSVLAKIGTGGVELTPETVTAMIGWGIAIGYQYAKITKH
jgi:hypothetical protein